MKLSEFILLSEPLKTQAVLNKGVLIAKRKTAISMVFLFQMEQYYVETYCDPVSKAVQQFQAFNGMRSLAPYLEQIDLHTLVAKKR